jgi:hypothetical protein
MWQYPSQDTQAFVVRYGLMAKIERHSFTACCPRLSSHKLAIGVDSDEDAGWRPPATANEQLPHRTYRMGGREAHRTL